jgi:predicted helicase
MAGRSNAAEEHQLEAEGLAGGLGVVATVSRAIHALSSRGALGRYTMIANGPGFPRAIANVLSELRLAAVDPDILDEVDTDLLLLVRASMSFTRTELEDKMSALANSRNSSELAESYRLCTTDQWNYTEARQFARRELWREHVRQVAYRPFDRRWTVLQKNVLTILRKQVMSQLLGKERNLGLICSRAVNDLNFAHCFVTTEPVDKIFISSKTSTNAYVFPLYFQQEDMYGRKRRPNLSRPFLARFAGTLSAKNAGEYGLPLGLTPDDIFHYAYAVFHSPGYRSRYAEFLKIDFPRLPLTANLELLRALAKLGDELVALHLLESPKLAQPITEFNGRQSPEVEKVSWSNNVVWIDKAQTTGFAGVSEPVWTFHIGGYQVCEKWLKDRKGRTLSKNDVIHYQKIVVALAETIRLMKEIDEVITAHGGWPGAF